MSNSDIDKLIRACFGYLSDGKPSTVVSVAFGIRPLYDDSDGEGEQNVQKKHILNVPVEFLVFDDVIRVKLDMSENPEEFADLFRSVSLYQNEEDKADPIVSTAEERLSSAEDEESFEKILAEMRTVIIPFASVYISPRIYPLGTFITFDRDPAYIIYESDDIDSAPSTISFIYSKASAVFRIEDEMYSYEEEAEENIDNSDEIRYLDSREFMNDDDKEDAFTDPRSKGLRKK